MGANEKLSLEINVQTVGQQNVDRLSEAMNRVVSISEKAGKSGSEFSNFPSAIKSFVQDPMATAEQSVIKFASGFGAAGVAVGGVVAGFSAFLAASALATRSLATLGIETQNIALKTGLTNKEVGQFGFAARAAGQDISVFETGMRKLSQGLADGGLEGKKTRDALDELGVKTRTLTGEIRPTSEIFEQVAAGISKMGSAAERNAAVVKIFGRSGIELVPVLESLNSNLARASQLGFGLDDATVARYEKYHKQITEVDAAWTRAKRHLEDGIAGTIFISLKGAGAALLESLSGSSQGDGATNPVKGVHSGGSGTVQSYLLGQLGNFKDANQLAGASSLIAGDEKAFQNTLAGAQAKLEDLKDKAKQARVDYFGGKGSVDEDTATNLRKKWQEAEKAARNYEDRVKVLTKADALRVAGIEKASALNRDAEGYFRLPGGVNGDVFITKSEQQAAIGRKPASILRPGEYNAAEEEFRDKLAGPISSGAYGGTFVSSSEDRRQPGFNGIATGGLFDDPKYKQDEQIKLGGLRNELDYTSRILELRAGPGGELPAALQINSLRLTAAEKEFEITNDIVALEDTRTKLAYERSALIEQDKAKERESFRSGAGGIFEAVTSGNASQALRSFGITLGRDLGKTIFENIATQKLFPAIEKLIPKSDNPLLKGTFLYDPVKANITALDLNTAALNSFRSTALSVSRGGGAASGSATATGLGGLFSGASSSNPFIFNNQPGNDSGIQGTAPTGPFAPDLIMTGKTNPKGIGFNGKTIGSVLAIGGGALEAFSGFSHGGARGALQGTAGALGSAAGIAALIPGGQVAALGLGIAAAATSFVSAILPDPKQVREKGITKALEQNKYYAPEALNVTQSTSGTFADFDARGNLRQSNFSPFPVVSDPYQWWKGQTPYDVPGRVNSPYGAPVAAPTMIIIQAVDAQSFNDMAQRNKDGLADAVASHLQNSDSRLTAAVRFVTGN